MCGISGIMHKHVGAAALAPIGEELVRMLDAMKHRGIDSTGITVAGEDSNSDFIVRVWSDPDADYRGRFRAVEEAVVAKGGVVRNRQSTDEFLRLNVNYEGDLNSLAASLYELPGVTIHSIGQNSEVVKDVGTGVELDDKHGIGTMKGTHGIGHVRLATESRVDITHSHPFWAYPFPDVTVVHNGQLTNYHKMKRKYEDEGHRFQTGNDSELIAVYLAEKLARGAALEDALYASLDDLDGSFTYLVSTDQGMGSAKDPLALKPLVLMETDDVVALASEEVALRSVFDEEIERVEPQQNEVMTWLI